MLCPSLSADGVDNSTAVTGGSDAEMSTQSSFVISSLGTTFFPPLMGARVVVDAFASGGVAFASSEAVVLIAALFSRPKPSDVDVAGEVFVTWRAPIADCFCGAKRRGAWVCPVDESMASLLLERRWSLLPRRDAPKMHAH